MPYSVGLLNSLPRLDVEGRERLTPIVGTPPSLLVKMPGCPFAPRCPMHVAECDVAEPALVPVDGQDPHWAACIRSAELRGQDRYEAGQVFEAGSTDATLPAEFVAGVVAYPEQSPEGVHRVPTESVDLSSPGPLQPINPIEPGNDQHTPNPEAGTQ
jgi:oligopeptide/dipeptide ABC transporter ATP-binding protein